MDKRSYGILLVFLATLLWSSAGPFVRLIDLDVWTLVAWRSLFASLSLFLFWGFLPSRRGQGLRLGWAGLASIPLAALSMVAYVAAIKLTTVANVMTVYATSPFVAAGIAFLLMREPMSRPAVLASLIALLGIAVMAGTALRPADLMGNGFAFLMTSCFATTLVLARRAPTMDATLMMALAGILCTVVCFLFASWSLPSLGQLVLLFLFSLASQSLSYLLFLLGGRHIPSAEAALIGLLDVVLGPLWVWFMFAEMPSGGALVGGTITLLAVAGYLFWRLRMRPVQPGFSRAASVPKA